MRTNKGNTWIVVLVVVVLALGAWWLYSKSNTPATNTPEGGEGTTTAATGKVYFSITDAAANMGNVTGVDMTVSKVEMHSATEGWVTVSSDVQKLSLLELKADAKSQLVAAADVKAGTYDQVRVWVDSVIVTTKDGKTHTAKVPSGKFKTMTDVVIAGGASSSVSMDFLADASLHTTGKGEYIFAPVVKVESKSAATVEVATDGFVTINGGNTEASGSFGMDANGEVKENFKLDTSAKLELDASGVIKVNGAVIKSTVSGSVQGGPTGTSLEQDNPSVSGKGGAEASVETGVGAGVN
ncbi:MAG TPA: DUF4382 domain-containing protein [Candidatus Paceibacterota bacterium]